jgi:VCBS repeat-containing protein
MFGAAALPPARGAIYMALITGTSGNDTLIDTSGNDTIQGQDGDDLITVTNGGDTVDGGAGTDTLIIDWSAFTAAVFTNGGPTVNGTAGGFNGGFTDYTARSLSYTSIEHLHIFTGSGADNFTTGGGNDIVSSGLGNDVINVGSGNDTADGGGGSDSISADLSAATGAISWNLQANTYSGPIGSFSNFEYFGVLTTGSGNDVVVTTNVAAAERINLGAGDDQVTVVNGGDIVDGGIGTDTLVIDWSAATAALNQSGGPTANGTTGGFNGAFTDYSGRSVSYTSFENFHITSGSGADNFTTASGNDIVGLGLGDDVVNVGSGDDIGDGGAGSDGISADLSAAAAAISWDLQANSYSGPIGSFTNFEYFGVLTTGSGNDVVVTTAAAKGETINLGAGDDRATVVLGGDSVNGGTGNDTLVIDWSGTTFVVSQNGGPTANAIGGFNGGFNDYSARSVSYTSIENFHITAGSGSDNFSTASGNDIVNLGLGDDFVNIGSGNDTGDGEAGSDGISADLSSATTTISWNLQSNLYAGPIGSFTNFEYFGTLVTGSGNDVVTTTSVAKGETISLGAGDDRATVVNGGDAVDGGAGNDTLVIDWSAGTFNANVNGGPTANMAGGFNGGFSDYAGRSVSYSQIENFYILTGSGADNLTTASGNDVVVTGNGNDVVSSGAGNDLVDGGGGNDSLNGGDGVDTLSYASATSAVTVSLGTAMAQITGGSGTDTVSNFENLTGSAFADNLTGTGLDNVIDGGLGVDSMTGGLGNDVYVADETGDVLNELAGGGTDRVESSANYSLGAEIENLTLTGTAALSGTGNALANHIIGNAGANLLDGGAGADLIAGGAGDDQIDGGTGDDQMAGGLGDDTFTVDSALDAISENAGEGADTVLTALASYALASEVENLTGTNNAGQALTGNGLANLIAAGTGADLIDGAGGDDVLRGGAGGDDLAGGAGSDTADYSQDAAGGGAAGVTVSLAAGTGTDGFGATDSYDSIENVRGTAQADILTGDDFANTLSGDGGDDRLQGGLGDDRIEGGAGADEARYASGGPADSIVSRSGDDLILNSALGAGTEGVDTLSGVETIRFAGADAILGTADDRVFSRVGGNFAVDADDDAGTATEAGGLANGTAGSAATGNVLANDVNIDQDASDFERVTQIVWTSATGPGTDAGDSSANLVAAVGSTVTAGRYGSLNISADGSYAYATDAAKSDRLDSGESATEVFTYTVDDGSGNPTTATITITINGANDAPVAANAAASGSENDISIGGTVSSTDADIESATYALVAGTVKINGVTVSDATVSLTSAGGYTYTPGAADQALDNGETRIITFDFVANDGSANSAAKTATITVNGANDAPVTGGAGSASGSEDAPVIGGTVPAATDVDVETLSYTLVAGSVLVNGAAAPDGTVTLNASGGYSYTPGAADQALDQGESRVVTFSYRASDGTEFSAPAQITITVNGANDAPVAAFAASSGSEDNSSIGGMVSSTDVDVESATYALVAGSVKINGVAAGDGTVSLTSIGAYTYTTGAADQALDDGEIRIVTFDYVANDGTVNSAARTVTITVNGANDAPVTGGDAGKAGTEDQATIAGQLPAASDVDGETLSYSLVAGTVTVNGGAAADGLVTVNASGGYSYSTANDQGLDTGDVRTIAFQYRSHDGTAFSAAATFTITESGINDAPVLGGSAGTVAFTEGNNSLSTPVTVDAGITVADVDDVVVAATVQITGNLAVGEDVLAFTNNNAASFGNIAASYDAATGTLALASAGATATTAQWQNALRAVTYNNLSETPNGATRTVSFTVSDGEASSNVATRQVTVLPVNDTPVNTVPGSQAGIEDTNLVFSSANGNAITVADADSSLTVTIGVLHGSLTLATTSGLGSVTGNGSANLVVTGSAAAINAAVDGLVYRGAPEYAGADTLSLHSSDGVLSDSDTVAINLDPDSEIDGTPGNDTLNGTSSNDIINGLAGNDMIDGGPGNDRMKGGTGDDLYIVDSVGDVVIELPGEGTDTVRTNLGSRAVPTPVTYVLPDNVENLIGTLGAAQQFEDNASNNVITTGAGADFIYAMNGGDDTVSSGGGNDFLFFGSTFDTNDTINAGNGVDRLGLYGDYVLTFGALSLNGVERLLLYSAPGNDFDYDLTTVDANVEAGALLEVAALSLGVGETLTFDGSAETDGSFWIRSGAGDDDLTGGAIGDRISGGLGADRMTGNGGADRFDVTSADQSTGAAFDTLVGFDASADRINIAGTVSGWGTSQAGELNVADFDIDLAALVDGALANRGAVKVTVTSGDHQGKIFVVVDADNDGVYSAGSDYVFAFENAVQENLEAFPFFS